jgi:hypothetical protein
VKAHGEVRTTLFGYAARDIVDDAIEHGADVIVMGCRGRGDLAGLVLGSTAHKVIQPHRPPGPDRQVTWSPDRPRQARTDPQESADRIDPLEPMLKTEPAVFRMGSSADRLMTVGLADPLVVELLESRERPGAVDGGRTPVHDEGDADRLGGFPGARAVLDRRVGVRGDAPVAFLADGDGQGDEFLGLDVQRAGGQRGVMEFLVAGVHLRDRVP